MVWRVAAIGAALTFGIIVAWLTTGTVEPTTPEGSGAARRPLRPRAFEQSTPAITEFDTAGTGAGTGDNCTPNSHDVQKTAAALGSGYTAARVYEMTLGNIQEVYAAEERSEPWATEREKAILDYTERDVTAVDPSARIEIDCRTSSCRIRVYSEVKHLVGAMGDYPYSCMARYGTADLEQGEPGSRYADFYILFGDQNQDSHAFAHNRDRTCPKYREDWLTFVRRPFP